MSDLIIESDEACTLARELSALNGESTEEAVTRALHERLLEARARRSRASFLLRAIAANAGPGIPVNHCWGEGGLEPAAKD
jgi:hypothetical protein